MTYIKYAALKGSVKCFKYLLINNAKIDKDDIALFAVSGGNNEIIRLCEQKKCSFDGTVKLSIKNHYHSIPQELILDFCNIYTRLCKNRPILALYRFLA